MDSIRSHCLFEFFGVAMVSIDELKPSGCLGWFRRRTCHPVLLLICCVVSRMTLPGEVRAAAQARQASLVLQPSNSSNLHGQFI